MIIPTYKASFCGRRQILLEATIEHVALATPWWAFLQLRPAAVRPSLHKLGALLRQAPPARPVLETDKNKCAVEESRVGQRALITPHTRQRILALLLSALFCMRPVGRFCGCAPL